MKRAHMYPPQYIFFHPPTLKSGESMKVQDYVSFIYQKYQFLSPS